MATALAVLSLPANGDASASGPGGLQNAGFEDGVLDSAPAAWSVTASSDAVRVVDAEGPSEFAAYADRNISVEPREGDLMLRLGTPKGSAQSQSSGANAVAQTFFSDATTLTFAMRVFSWEHRGHDAISFDLRDASQPAARFPVRDAASGNALQLTMPNGSSVTCATTPCQLPLDVGDSGMFYDSGWLEVEISGLPDDHRPLTLSYNVRPDRNTAHPTWAYFDAAAGVATGGPVARFTFAPTEPLEADFVQFVDQSAPPGDGTIVSWSWEISGPGVSATSDLQHAVFSFPDEGAYDVRLTVTDDAGRTDSVQSGAIAKDGTPVPAVVVQNASARISALNVEMLAGAPAPLFGRFADPGWQDTHVAQWSVTGASPAQVLEENEPSFATGIATGDLDAGPAGSSLQGTLTVEDEDGGTASDTFEVRVLGADFDRREPNDGSASAPVLPAGWRYLSDLSSPLDIDVFEVVLPDGSALVAGSEILVTLDALGADYDLAVLTESNTNPYEASPWFSSPWFSSPWFSSPWFSSPWFSSPWFSSPWLSSDLTFEQLALSTMAYGIPAGSDLNAADVSLVELGLAPLADENLQVVGHSANRGTASEAVLVRVPDDGQRIFIAVAGYNGAYTQQPYAFTVEASRPLDLDAFLGAGCDGAPLVTAGATSAALTLYDHPGADLSLIVTQRERMMALYGLDAAAWDELLADLVALANHPSVAADIVSMPSTIYDAWDADPCSVAAANATAEAVRDVIVARMTADPGKRFVVLAGNDDVIPHRRVPDATAVGNEREYLLDSFVVPGSPLFASMQQSQFLSDDFYGDPDPQAWQGRELFVPDWELGRLVETPTEIRGAARAFVESDGRLAMSTALVTGYDFFQDGAHATADNLATTLQTERIISDDWTADALRCRFLGEPLGAGCATHDVNAPFAHFTHYGALAAHGFNTQDFEDYISSQDVASAGGGAGLAGSLTFTIGCHAGLSVPDRAAVPPEAGLPVDASLDLAQAMARQRAVLVGNTGFGL
ncbi:MAG TPA: PKD domain-containing protein, partial [Dehalococcoidia bacterium]|nr:PKD domain-containing protein [Dehalococcoidia bacterium]